MSIILHVNDCYTKRLLFRRSGPSSFSDFAYYVFHVGFFFLCHDRCSHNPLKSRVKLDTFSFCQIYNVGHHILVLSCR